MLAGIGVAAVATIFQLASTWPALDLAFLIPWAALVLIFAALTIIFFQRGELLLLDGALIRVNLFGIATRYALEEIGGMARRDVDYPLALGPTQYVVVYDRRRRCLFKMDRLLWDPGDIALLHSYFGGESGLQRVDSWTFAAEFPGSVPRILNHPFVILLVSPLLILALFIGILLVADAAARR